MGCLCELCRQFNVTRKEGERSRAEAGGMHSHVPTHVASRGPEGRGPAVPGPPGEQGRPADLYALGTAELQSWEVINLGVLSHSTCSDEAQQQEETHTEKFYK